MSLSAACSSSSVYVLLGGTFAFTLLSNVGRPECKLDRGDKLVRLGRLDNVAVPFVATEAASAADARAAANGRGVPGGVAGGCGGDGTPDVVEITLSEDLRFILKVDTNSMNDGGMFRLI